MLNHVCLHQTIIGLEAIAQMEIAEDEPDVVIACVGGGSNFAGLAFPYYHRKLEGKSNARLLAVEPKACPTLTAGEYKYDLGDEAGMTPQMLMYTLGHDFVPAGIHAGGLRYHGDSPLVSQLVFEGEADAIAVDQTACFAAAVQFARAEGILPAPESSHAILAAIQQALEAAEAGEDRCILFNLSGHGHFDLAAYAAYNAGDLQDYDFAAGATLCEASRQPLPRVRTVRPSLVVLGAPAVRRGRLRSTRFGLRTERDQHQLTLNPSAPRLHQKERPG